MSSTEPVLSEPKMRIVVIENEADIRQWLIDRLRSFPEIEVVGEAIGVDSGFKIIAAQRPDALFLDIKIVGGDAFMLLKKLRENDLPIPPIIMTTGFPEFAVEAINQNFTRYVKKYLVKPFVDDWEIKLRDSIDALRIAIGERQNQPVFQPVQAASQPVSSGPTKPDFIFLKKEGDLIKVFFSEIVFVEVAGSGNILVATDGGELLQNLTMTKFLEQLPGHFLQISRFNAVNLNRVVRLVREEQGVMVVWKGKEKFLGAGEKNYSQLLHELPQIRER